MPNWPYNDEHTSDRSAIEQCRIRRNSGFQACIDAISEMGKILSECSEVGRKATEEKSCTCLMEGLGGTPQAISRNLTLANRVDGSQSFEGGDEHYILLFSEEHRDKRVLKWTYGDNFGLHLKVFEHDPELMDHHVISSGNPDPIRYLNRWIILNNIGPPITRFEGILPPDFLRNERLAGLPKPVLARAKAILSHLEMNSNKPASKDKHPKTKTTKLEDSMPEPNSPHMNLSDF